MDKVFKNATTIRNLLKKTLFFSGKNDCVKIYNFLPNDILLKELNFSVRFSNTLRRIRLKTLGELLNTPHETIAKIRNCGAKSIQDARKEILFFIEGKFNQDAILDFIKFSQDYTNKIEFPFLGSLPPKKLKIIYQYLDKPLKNFEFPVRFQEYLKLNENFRTVADLLKINGSTLLQKKNLGKETLSSVKKILLDQFIVAKVQENENKNLLDLIDSFVLGLNERTKLIFMLRWNDVASLEEVGDILNLTRERVRQIISQNLGKLRKKILPNIENYRELFLSIILENPNPITFNSLENRPLFSRNYKGSFYLAILSALFEEVPFEGLLRKNFEYYVTSRAFHKYTINTRLNYYIL